MFDVKAIEAEAREEVAKEEGARAKGKIKAHLAAISKARAVVANLEREYEVLLREIGSDTGD